MQLTKHHGLGNDFLVLVDLDDLDPIDADIAIAVCDRHRGVGADGLIRVTRGDHSPFRMELRNEDGSRAEMSGNGISCLGQAIVLAGLDGEGLVRVDTDAGQRVVTMVERLGPAAHRMRVEMGSPTLGDALPEWESAEILRAVHVDVGNPHVVCQLADPSSPPDLVALGERINAATPGGTNVEIISPDTAGEIDMDVYERGVGPTQACGTGAVASALAAQHWGLAGDTVTVHQPGGPAVVEVGDPSFLTVPVVAVARLSWPF